MKKTISPSRRAAEVLPLLPETQLPARALKLIRTMEELFGDRRVDLLIDRGQRRLKMHAGEVGRLEDTAHIRNAEWTVDEVPAHLLERRVELLGGVKGPELVEGLNSGAMSYVADLWNMGAQGAGRQWRAHRKLRRAAAGTLTSIHPKEGRRRIHGTSRTRLMFVPRPLHVDETELHIGGRPATAAFVDLALFMVNNAQALMERQGGVFFYLRGVHGHLEARLWRELFDLVEEEMDLTRGTVRATVMVDNVTCALEADEVLFELMHHSAGLSLDPQAYAADHIALFSARDRNPFPDRERIGLDAHLLRSVSLMVIGTCHRRAAYAMGAPSFVLPPEERGHLRPGYAEMLADKAREAADGHDGTLVGHPGIVNAAMMEFNKSMARANQLFVQRNERISARDLVERPEGTISVESLVGMVRTCLRTMVARSQGQGLAVQGGRVHDRSSLRLCVLLLWQWCLSEKGLISDSGLEVHDDLVRYLVNKERTKMYASSGTALESASVQAAKELLELVLHPELPVVLRD